MTQNKHYSSQINPNLLGEIYRQNKALAQEIDAWHDNQILQSINEQYLAQFEELQALFRHQDANAKKHIQHCSIYAYLWSKEKKDICKRGILKIAFNQVVAKQPELAQNFEAHERLWAQLKEQYGSRDTYPKPYINITPADVTELSLNYDKYKYAAAYNVIEAKLFRAILLGQGEQSVLGMSLSRSLSRQSSSGQNFAAETNHHSDAVAILIKVHELNPGFKCDYEGVNLNLIRDTGRILSLRLATCLTQLVTKISQNEDIEENCKELIRATVLLVQLLKFQTQDDRHRHVIVSRFQNILGTNVLQKHAKTLQMYTELTQNPDAVNFTELFKQPDYNEFAMQLPTSVDELFEGLSSSEGWKEWKTLKADTSSMTLYASAFEQFKKDMDVWMKWHQQCANNQKFQWSEAMKLGTEFEARVGVSLSNVQK